MSYFCIKLLFAFVILQNSEILYQFRLKKQNLFLLRVLPLVKLKVKCRKVWEHRLMKKVLSCDIISLYNNIIVM